MMKGFRVGGSIGNRWRESDRGNRWVKGWTATWPGGKKYGNRPEITACRMIIGKSEMSRYRWPAFLSRLLAGIAGSNPAGGMDGCLLCLYAVLSCVGRGLCEKIIPRPKESYRVCK
jgi:hypothetical protein